MCYSRPWLFGVFQGSFAFGYNGGRLGCCVALDMVLGVDCGALAMEFVMV